MRALYRLTSSVSFGLVIALHLTGNVNAAAGEERSGLVVNVVDGDTLKLVENGQKIRLTGVDACEISQKARSPLGQTIDCGTDPKAALIRWTANKTITCQIDGQDTYKRLLATCGNDEIPDFAAELIRQGLAVAYRYKGRVTEPVYEQIEQTAKQGKVGLWALDFDQPWTYRRHN
ncbi:endonuclease YncB(thermonuclease family) [Ochrobactrum intermedium]|uniref:Endonuclease YncB(Thermonuclease family) n=1 Tax=Brucella intermedia TaxID=94625 RepID=A0ABR6AWM6_9HYPH|nr:thermonuclease family protein [Brucella intermedia]MBA8853846.1 endonuclease YncB(thermonuclease family) [Brucella intermedia]